MTRLGLDLWQDPNLLAYLEQQQQMDFEIAPEQLPEPVAKIVREHKAEFGDTIDSEDELRQLMKLLDIPRMDPQQLSGMSSQELLALLIDWLQNGGGENNQPGRNLGSLN